MHRNFKVSPNNVSQQLSLSWEIPSIANGQILLYQYCYIKFNDSNQICGNTTDNSSESVNITNLGECFSTLFVMNCTIWRSSCLIYKLICREEHSTVFYPMSNLACNVLARCNLGIFT